MKETEITTTLNMAEKTVSMHLYRARRQLIARLKHNCPFASDNEEEKTS